VSERAAKTLLVFRSIHHVLAAERALKAAGLQPDLVPVPKDVSPNCGMAITIAAQAAEAAAAVLADNPPVATIPDWAP